MPDTTTLVFEFCQVTTGAAGVPVIPSKINPATGLPFTNAVWPYANTRQIVILNRGANPLLFSVTTYSAQNFWPSNFGGAGSLLTLTEGENATRIPAGASLTIELSTFQERGNFTAPFNYAAPVVPAPLYFPFNLITFASTAAGITNADIMYVNKLGVY